MGQELRASPVRQARARAVGRARRRRAHAARSRGARRGSRRVGRARSRGARRARPRPRSRTGARCWPSTSRAAASTPNARATARADAAKSAGSTPQLVRRELDAAPRRRRPMMLEKRAASARARRCRSCAQAVGEERLALSLYHALGLAGLNAGGRAGPEALRRGHARDRPDARIGPTATLYKTMLAKVKLYLLDAGPARVRRGPRHRRQGGDGVRRRAHARPTGRDRPGRGRALLRQRGRAWAERRSWGGASSAELARENDAVIEIGAAVDYVACPSCNAPHPRGIGARRRCVRCGTALFVRLPADGCRTRNDATAAALRDLRDRPAAATRRRRGGCARCPTALTRRPRRVGRGRARGDRRACSAPNADPRRAAPPRRQASSARHRRSGSDAEAAIADAPAVRRAHRAAQLVRVGRRRARADRRTARRTRRSEDRAPAGEVDAVLARARAAEGARARGGVRRGAARSPRTASEAASGTRAIAPGAGRAVHATMGPAGPVVDVGGLAAPGARYASAGSTSAPASARRPRSATPQRCEDRDAPTGAIVRYEVDHRARPSRSAGVAVHAAARGARGRGRQLRRRRRRGAHQLAPVPASARVIVERDAADGASEQALLADRSGTGRPRRAQRRALRLQDPRRVQRQSTARRRRTAGLTLTASRRRRPRASRSCAVQHLRRRADLEFDRPPAGTVTILRCDGEPTIALGDDAGPEPTGRSSAASCRAAPDGARDHDASERHLLVPAGDDRRRQRDRRARACAISRSPTIGNVNGGRRGPTRCGSRGSGRDGVRVAKVIWRRDRQPAGPDDPRRRSAPGCASASTATTAASRSRRTGASRSSSAVVPACASTASWWPAPSSRAGARRDAAGPRRSDLRYAVRRAGHAQEAPRGRGRARRPATACPASCWSPAAATCCRARLPRATSLARLGGGEPLSSTIDLAAAASRSRCGCSSTRPARPRRSSCSTRHPDDLLIR